MSKPVTLPAGTIHGTPEGHQAGCKGDNARCPAEAQHGMSCTSAYVRSTTTPEKYFRAKAMDDRPAAIAHRLGFEPKGPTERIVSRPRARAKKPTTVAVDSAPTMAPGGCLVVEGTTVVAELEQASAVLPIEDVALPHRPLGDDGELERARGLAARLWDRLHSAERSLVFVLQRWGTADAARSGLEASVNDALRFIDMTISGNEGCLPDLPWHNSEVLEMLQLIRKSLIGDVNDGAPSDATDESGGKR